MNKKSRWAMHVERWSEGCGSTCCGTAKNVCLGRGKVPCDIMFLGEAPGESEDVLGSPFMGPAGLTLDNECTPFGIVQMAKVSKYRLSYTNLVGCIPRDHEKGGKAAQPLPEDVECCSERLQEFVEIADPSLIVCVGKLSEDYLDPKVKERIEFHRSLNWYDEWDEDRISCIAIEHPASLLRAPIVQQGLKRQRCVMTIARTVQKMKEAGWRARK